MEGTEGCSAGNGPFAPSERTKRLLFGTAVHCAFPTCKIPVAVIIDGLPSPGAQVAHIRAAEHDGPRHDCAYRGVHEFDNLLLLCGLHHGHVDYHLGQYPVPPLEHWKAAQLEQPGKHIAAEHLDELVGQLDKLREELGALKREGLFVELVGGLGVENQPPRAVLLPGMRDLAVAGGDGETYLGVRMLNRLDSRLTVVATGVDFDYGEPDPSYFFPTQLAAGTGGITQTPFQLEEFGEKTYFAATPSIGHCLRILAEKTQATPPRVRAWSALELGDRLYGTWVPLLGLVKELVGAREADSPPDTI